MAFLGSDAHAYRLITEADEGGYRMAKPGLAPSRHRYLWRWDSWHRALTLFFGFSSFILAICLWKEEMRPSCHQKWSTYSPLLSVLASEPQTWTFNGSFSHPSPYKGPPTDSVDRTWDQLYNLGLFRISTDDLYKIGGDPNSVKWPAELGGGYVGFLESLHQLHCVNFLWQHGYKEYYQSRGGGWLDSESVRMEHFNHCADLLRQKLMCDADVGLIPMYWVKNHGHPWPNFSTRHKCRDFDRVWQWVKEHEVQLPENFTLPKPLDAMELESPP